MTEMNRMGVGKKLLIGGIGALMPTVAVLLTAEGSIIGSFEDGWNLAGYGLRVGLLFLLGGFWVWLHQSEQDPMKIFQLGIVAPAMITGVIQAKTVSDLSPENSANGQTQGSVALFSPAYAGSHLEQPAPSPNPSTFDCLIKGFLGQKC